MRFNAPGLLTLLAVPVALGVAYALMQARRSRYAVQLTNLELLDEVAPDRPGWRRHLPAAALLLALLALVIALARPVRAQEVPVELATVVLALDTSISMDARDVAPRRLDAAQAAALAFVDQVPEQVRIGLVAFAETAIPLVAPTDDHQAVRTAIERLQLRPGTAIGEALLASVELLQADLERLGAGEPADGEDRPIPATMVLLSDGDTTVGRPNEVGIAAAREAGLPVNTIAFGTPNGIINFEGQLLPVPVNAAALQRIAEQTGGRFHDAETASQLTDVFEDLGSSVGTTTEDVEVTAPFVAAALVLGSAAAIGSLRWFSRLP